MLKKHNKHGPLKWLAGALAAVGLMLAIPIAQPVYAEGSSPAVQTSYVGFSSVSDVKVNQVSVQQYGYYHIAFNGNGGNGSIDPMTLVTDETENLPANVFTRDGYTWTGWNTKADGTGTAYKDEQSVKNLTDKSDSTITLYAQWRAESQTAKFKLNYNDGTASVPEFDGSSDTITKNTDQTLGTLPKLKDRSGYDFEGWYTDAVSGTKISSDTTMPAGGATYYAHWTIRTYQIKYSTDYGTIGGAHPKTYTVEDRVTIPMPEGSSTGVFKDASGADWYFTGWHINGVSGFPTTAVLEKETTGNKIAQATFDANGFRVTCEDWTADIGDGSVYTELGELPESDHANDTFEGIGNQNSRHRIQRKDSGLPFHYAKLGETVSGADWGDSTVPGAYYGDTQYSGATHQVVTGNCTVYRYINISYPFDVRDRFQNPVAATATLKFYDMTSTGSAKELSPIDTYRSVYGPKGRVDTGDLAFHFTGGPVKTFNISSNTMVHYTPDAREIDDVVFPSGYTLYDKEQYNYVEKNGVWVVDHNKYPDMLAGAFGFVVTNGNAPETVSYYGITVFHGAYQPNTNIWSWESALNGTGSTIEAELRKYVDSMTLVVEEPGKAPVEHDLSWYAQNQTFKTGTKLTLKSLKMKEGYVFGGMMSFGMYNNPRIVDVGDSMTLNMPSGYHQEEFLVYDDDYIVRYEANGGTGNEMSNQAVPRFGTHGKVAECTYENKYGRFLGWSTNPDGSSEKDVMFHAGDDLPYDLGNATGTVNLYAVWDWYGDDEAQNAKSSGFTVFDSMQE